MSRPGLTSTRKFRRLSRTLGSRLVAMGALELVWQACWDACDDHVGTAAEIEDLVGWTGTPGALVEALIDAGAPDQEGFLEQIERVNSGETTYRVHDLWDHAPDYVLKRRQRQEQRHQLLNPGDKRRRRVNRAADTRGTNGAARSTIRPTSVHVTAVHGSTRYDSTQQGKGRGAADATAAAAAVAPAPPPKSERPRYDAGPFCVFDWQHRDYQHRLAIGHREDFDLDGGYRRAARGLSRPAPAPRTGPAGRPATPRATPRRRSARRP